MVEESKSWDSGFLGTERMRMGEHWERICDENGENRCLGTGILNSSGLRKIWWTWGTFFKSPREDQAYGRIYLEYAGSAES